MFIPSNGNVHAKGPVRRNSRNFVLENRQMVSQHPKEKSKARHSYDRPTIGTLARSSGAHGAQRRPADGTVRTKRFAEKEIQTEDISDERFLSAAMLKCSEKGHFRPARSEGDEPELREGESCSKSLYLRRTASSFELGRMPEQRDGYQSGQYTLPRPLATGFGIVPSSGDQSSAGDQSSSRSSTPRVRQMDIPEMVDVDLEESLSMRSLTSCDQLFDPPPEQPQEQELEEMKPQMEHRPEEQLESESNPMSGELRLVLLEAARERQRQLIAEYNRLPISMGTLRVRNLKRLLEEQLDVVDNDVSVLSEAKANTRQFELLNCNRKRLFR